MFLIGGGVKTDLTPVAAGSKALGDTLSAGRPTDLYLDLAAPETRHIPPGVGGWGGSDYILYRGPRHYGRFGLATWV